MPCVARVFQAAKAFEELAPACTSLKNRFMPGTIVARSGPTRSDYLSRIRQIRLDITRSIAPGGGPSITLSRSGLNLIACQRA